MIYGDWIGRAGRSFPDKEALVDAITGRRYSYGQMASEVNRLTGFPDKTLGVEKGGRVAGLSFNRAEYIFLFFAVSRLGAILTPLNFLLAPAEFDYFFDDASPKALFFDLDHQQTAAGIKDRIRVDHCVCFDDDDSEGLSLPKGVIAWNSINTKRTMAGRTIINRPPIPEFFQ